MAKKRINDLNKECPICGSIIWGKGIKVLIEGAKIVVCQVCAKHGKKIITPEKSVVRQTRNLQLRRDFKKSEFEDNFEIVDDFNHRIRKVRQTLKLNQDQFAQKLNEKPSLIRRIEAGKVQPTIKLAKKIEKVYKIKLLEKTNKVEASIQTDKFLKKPTGSSLGDIAFIKKKKKDDD